MGKIITIFSKGVRKDMPEEEFRQMVKSMKMSKGAPMGNRNAAKDYEGKSGSADTSEKNKLDIIESRGGKKLRDWAEKNAAGWVIDDLSDKSVNIEGWAREHGKEDLLDTAGKEVKDLLHADNLRIIQEANRQGSVGRQEREIKDTGNPEPGKIYALTNTAGQPSIAAGNTLKESEVKQDTPKEAKFKSWYNQVDKEIASLIGLSANDLPDYLYRDAHNAGKSPKAVARAVIRAAKDDFGL